MPATAPPLPDTLRRAASGPVYVIVSIWRFDGEVKTQAVATADRDEAREMLRGRAELAPTLCLAIGLDVPTTDITATLSRRT